MLRQRHAIDCEHKRHNQACGHPPLDRSVPYLNLSLFFACHLILSLLVSSCSRGYHGQKMK